MTGMVRGNRSYYTPISADGQVVEKRVDSIEVSRDDDTPLVAVSYTLSNPYTHPVTVPIQSGLTMLYQYSQTDDDPRDPELHVVPATVTRHSNGELLYVANESDAVFGTTVIQRRHLGTGIPNYRHPVAVRITLVPGDSVELEARATIPARVQRMILVDAMVGPDQPYGIYPQLLQHPTNEDRVPPPLRLYQGASFRNDPPHVEMPPRNRRQHPRAIRLPRWLSPDRFEQLQRALQQTGRLWSYAIGIAAVLLSLSVAVRMILSGLTTAAVAEGARAAGFALLAAGTIRRHRMARHAFVGALAVSALEGLARLAIAIVREIVTARSLLTEAAFIPILYLAGAALLLWLPSGRAHTNVAIRRNHDDAHDT